MRTAQICDCLGYDAAQAACIGDLSSSRAANEVGNDFELGMQATESGGVAVNGDERDQGTGHLV